MGKQKGQPSAPGRMTVMLIQLEGDDSTLQEGIRTFKDAMARAMPHSNPRANLLPSTPLAAIASQVEVNSNGRAPTENDGIDGGTIVVDSPGNASTARSSSPRKPPVMNFVNDLNLRPPGKNSLKSFVQEKKPKSQLEKITVSLHYLCRTLELTGITGHHVYTCLKEIGCKTPNDLPQALRNIAKRKGYVDASNGEDLKMTNSGDNFVEHDLPRAS